MLIIRVAGVFLLEVHRQIELGGRVPRLVVRLMRIRADKHELERGGVLGDESAKEIAADIEHPSNWLINDEELAGLFTDILTLGADLAELNARSYLKLCQCRCLLSLSHEYRVSLCC